MVVVLVRRSVAIIIYAIAGAIGFRQNLVQAICQTMLQNALAYCESHAKPLHRPEVSRA